MIGSTAMTLLALLAAPPAPEDAGGGEATPVPSGSTVEFDRSALPARFEGAGKATCTGTVIKAIGPTEVKCERTYKFEVPPAGAQLVYVFQPVSGGRERRVEVPLLRDLRPMTFRAPSDGTLRSPGPLKIPAEVTDAAAKAGAAAACRECKGGAFTVQSFEMTQPPFPVGGTTSVRIRIIPPGAR